MAEYDISGAFGRIEDELISSMIRNLDRHRAEETDMGYNWVQWQAEQLKALERYKRENRKKFGPEFKDINNKIEAAIRQMEKKGGTDAEREILNAIKKGYNPSGSGTKGTFFKTNKRKMDALIKATTDDMKKAETAILRMANDKYRKIIFDAQTYANSGAGTYAKAVDMATKDMAAAGLNCVEYKNGARHRLEDYADMAIRTANKRAYLYGEGERRKAWGVTTVIVNKRTGACPKCLPFCGKVFIDDIWSGGTAKDGDYPLLSSAVDQGLYHPRCKDSHTTYFPGISKSDGSWTKSEIQELAKKEERENVRQYYERQAEKWGRIAETRLDPENRSEAEAKSEEWNSKASQNTTVSSDATQTQSESENGSVNYLCDLDKNIYECITEDIVSEEVIITDERIQHIKDRHPNDYETYYEFIKQAIISPDYIVEANKPNSGLLLKEFVDGDVHIKMVLRLVTSTDDASYRNSVITFMRIGEKEWNRLLKNKKILYKRT